MKPFKSTLFILFCLITTCCFSQYTEVINSNRPGVSRSAFSVGKNVVQFEIGPYFVKEKRTPATTYEVSGLGADFAARYGLLFEELEINIEGNYQNDIKKYTYNADAEDKRANFKHLSFGAKYLVYDPYKNEEANKPNLYSWKANHGFKWNDLIPAIAVYAGINYDTKNNPYTAPGIEGFSPKIMIATQNNFSGGWVLVMNLIKDRIGTNQSDFQYILTLTHSFNPKWVIFGETQGIQSEFYADNLFRVGGAHLLSKDFQLDAAITFNTKDTPSVFNASLGASYRLDFHRDPEAENTNDNSFKPTKRNKSSRKNKDSSDNKINKRKKKAIDFD
ncbi:transporter [Seonamhaeicola aphaedonensis]|uniref:Outer membrane putative beta-barrel porin/alpha-amylase n=1 Tax=Seonamhaeicola aphaedonensis TaxID=1461338 RepID=A0A3D9HIS4_9FLAO|nr:transporter [Seonamhaeicola aphaedonensis]RED49397.1 outer membrane putative beta-barrel porin/alpha-amylase [Seonamhaeicola aphaedonensis]